jgi:hypothetical protein
LLLEGESEGSGSARKFYKFIFDLWQILISLFFKQATVFFGRLYKRKNRLTERRTTPMTDTLKRDITGECEGECRDRVREGEEERQDEIKLSNVETPESYPDAHWARSRNEPPGVFGGHV